jgi:sarcosine oxidase, subunit beta
VRGYSLFSLIANGVKSRPFWQPAWRKGKPKSSYDVVVVGAGGHGLATAYYLASRHGITNVAVIDSGWLGGGNTARNTAVVRSEYARKEHGAFYVAAMDLWEGLSHELNFNQMVSARGVIRLYHSEFEMDGTRLHADEIRANGSDWEFLSMRELATLEPLLDLGRDKRFPVIGAAIHRRGGIARHDSAAWGYARAASALGVDIIERCTVRQVLTEGDHVVGVETDQGTISARTVCVCAVGAVTAITASTGLRLPIRSIPLQAMVTEPVKPILDHFVASGSLSFYASQSAKGEIVIGGHQDEYGSFAQIGSQSTLARTIAGFCEAYPALRHLRLMRHWGGNIDMTPDESPIIGKTPISGLLIDCGFGHGGFKATPIAGFTLAHTIAHGDTHPLIAGFGLDRFDRGALRPDTGLHASGAH